MDCLARLLTLSVVLNVSLANVNAQSIKLPSNTNVYPDSFAIYWRKERAVSPTPEFSISIELRSVFGDVHMPRESYVDTLATLYCDPGDAKYGDMIIDANFPSDDARSRALRRL